MKGYVVLSLSLLSIFLLSCTKEDLEKANALSVSPPDWIQGKWSIKDSTSGNRGWKFTLDSAVKIDELGNETNILSSFFFLIGLTGEEVTVEEFNSSGFYSIEINTETSSSRYDFSRISDNEISWDNAPPINGPEHYLKTE